MKKIVKMLCVAMVCVIGAAFLIGCGGEKKTAQRELKVYNWGDFIAPDVLKDFEKETGIHVIYDTFATNEDMYVKVKSGGSDYDVAVPSEYMIKRMIKEGLVEKIEYSASC